MPSYLEVVSNALHYIMPPFRSPDHYSQIFVPLAGIGVIAYSAWQAYKSFKVNESSVLDEGWFTEISQFWPGQAFSLKMKKILYSGKSDYQNCLCFESEKFGKVLVLDGAIQCTEKDECSYHEMLANIALLSHPDPTDILVVGGGDGGIARELCKDPMIKRVDVCELDEMVVRVSELYLPTIAVGFEDPRVRIIFEDGYTFVRNHPNQYDVIIVDSSDPVGPAEALYSSSFYAYLSKCLKPGGIAVTQAENLWIHMPLIKTVLQNASKHFKHVDYCNVNVPSYPLGSIGFACCSKGESCKTPKRKPSETHQNQLKYYNTGTHVGAFLLPTFFQVFMNSEDTIEKAVPQS